MVDTSAQAYAVFETLLDGRFRECLTSLVSEEDVRHKFITPLFEGVFGWPAADIHLERFDPTGGRLDYKMVIGGRTRLVVEAKRYDIDLGIRREHSARSFKLSGPVLSKGSVNAAVEQLFGYCSAEGCELACATNGRQWLVFRGTNTDGRPVREGKAIAFGSLDSVKENFIKLHDLLSRDAVDGFRFRAVFQEVENQPARSTTFFKPARAAASRHRLSANAIHHDLDRFMTSIFKELDDLGDEARLECFVTSAESDEADRELVRISVDLLSEVRKLDTAESEGLVSVVARAREDSKHELVLLVGIKGSGKSTFIERFFSHVLPPPVRADCVVATIDLSHSGGDPLEIGRWLDRTLLNLLEKVAYSEREASFEELQGMFFGEYKRLSSGPLKPLYDSDKQAFRITFGEKVEQIRTNDPKMYIAGILHQISRSWKKVPCVIFDNADHFGVPFQEAVFNYARSIYLNSSALVVLPITDTTSWQLSKEGPFQSFHRETFYLPSPKVEQVLGKRLEYIERAIRDQPAEAGKGYTFGRGLPLEIENIKSFAAALGTVFVQSGSVAEWIGRLSNHDIRRSLEVTRRIASSPHLDVASLLKAYVQKDALEVSEQKAKLAVTRGNYDIYSIETVGHLQNLYAIPASGECSPLLALRVLQYLRGVAELHPQGDRSYVMYSDVLEYFAPTGVSPAALRSTLGELLESGLALNYDPTVRKVHQDIRMKISPAGEQHSIWGQGDGVYLETMAFVTPVHDQDLYEYAKHVGREPSTTRLQELVSRFAKYLMEEDSMYITIPQYDTYAGQLMLPERLTAKGGRVSNTETTHGCRTAGVVVKLDEVGRWGFIRPRGGGRDMFFHINDVTSKLARSLTVGQAAEFTEGQGSKGPKAVDVVLHDT